MMDDYVTHRRWGINYMRRDEQVSEEPGHATDLFTGWAVDYVKERAAGQAPFFLYLAYNAPHVPIQPPREWLDRVRARDPRLTAKRASLVALIEHMDDGMRREGGDAFMGQTSWAIRRGPWKLLQNTPTQAYELYNLAADPQERNDLAASEVKQFRELATALRAHVSRSGAVPWHQH